MTVALGWVPIKCVVTLSAGGDFTTTLTATPPWPAGTGIELRFSPTPAEGLATIAWPATVMGADAVWNVPAAVVQLVIDAEAFHATVHYTTVDGTLVWLKGRVRVS